MNNNDPGLRRLMEATGGMLTAFPFFGALTLELDLAEATPEDRVESMATDGQTILYNADWLDMTPLDDIRFVVSSLVMGCGLKHHTRREDRDPAKWQVASRIVREGMVREAGMPPRRGYVEHEVFEAMSAEEVYRHLPDPPAQEGDDGDGGGADTDPGEIRDFKGPKQPEGDSADGDGSSSDQPQPQPSGGGGGDAGATDPTGRQVTDEERRWDSTMEKATALAAAAGVEHANIRLAMTEGHQRPAPWSELMRSFMQSTAQNDYAWFPPDHRRLEDDLYLPSMTSDAMGEVVLVVDTSGSTMHVLDAFWREARAIAGDVSPETVHVLAVDTEVCREDSWHPLNLPASYEVEAGGGTSFAPAFEHIERQGWKPACIVYLTDGYNQDVGAMRSVEPPCPVLWCLSAEGARNQPFGERILIAEAA